MHKKNPKICFIASAGGHLEQLKQLKEVAARYEHYYVIPKNPSTRKFVEKKYLISWFSRKEKLKFPFKFAWTALQQLFIFLKERPDVVITTGAGVVYPTCMYAHWTGKKVVYIESFARIHSLNVTGQKLYPYADLFVVQWKDLLNIVPKAVYGGWIY